MHTIREKTKLIARVRRIRGQIDAVERLLAEERGCEEVMHAVVTARGAINSLATEILCGHLEDHLGPSRLPRKERTGRAADLVQVIRQCFG